MKHFLRPRRYTGLTAISLFALLLLIAASALGAEEIIKSPNDQRDYAAMTLENGLRVVLVSDPDTDKAAASLDVNVGAFQDPDDRPGLAHFLEHMLFLGTKKYPDADAYKEFISNHGGMDNAFTSSEDTTYFFDIDKDYLDGALDRFAQFFIAPLFNEKYVQREKNAVDSEYRLKIKDDGRRIYEVLKATANPEHPYSHFTVGNLDSLSDREDSKTRDELIRFYKNHYSANLMTLAVVGKESLPELKKMVQRFTAVPNRHITIKPVKVPLYTRQQTRLNIKPLQELRQLSLSFTTPWHDSYYQDKPFEILAHLLGHEGKNSLHALLKDKGWINGLAAGSGIMADNYTTFDIDIDLTDEGLKHIDEITTNVFQAIDLIRKKGVKLRIHEELEKIDELNFRFQEKSSPSRAAVTIAGNLQHYPARLVLKGPYVSDHFSVKQVESILNDMTVDNLHQIVIAPGLKTDQVEPYYHTDYSIRPLSTDRIKAWRQAGLNKRLAIPGPNPFIPDDTTVITTPSGEEIPELIIDKPDVQVWHKQDDEFNVPKADISIGLTMKNASDTLSHRLESLLFTSLVVDDLNAYTYPALLAGLHYGLDLGRRGIGISVSGYNDKQQILIERIIDTLLTYKVDPERFAVVKERLKHAWKNSHLDRPYHQLNQAIGWLMQPNSWTPDAYLKVVDSITVADLEQHIRELRQAGHITMLIHGNIDKAGATTLADAVIHRLRQQVAPAPELAKHAVKLKQSGQARRFSLPIDHNDSAIISYYQAPDDRTRTQASTLLLLQMLDTPFFNVLRTQQQLGYVVYTGLDRSLRIPGLKFVVQSPVQGPEFLLEHIDAFLQQQYEQIRDMDAAAFAEYKQAILTRILEKDKRLGERTHRYRRSLALKYLGFDHRDEVADAIRALTLKEVSDFYRTLFLADRTRHLIVESTGNIHKDEADKQAVTLDMKQIEAFRSAEEDYSL
jgi:secreted Zn-dependent insulinase-like peptidase